MRTGEVAHERVGDERLEVGGRAPSSRSSLIHIVLPGARGEGVRAEPPRGDGLRDERRDLGLRPELAALGRCFKEVGSTPPRRGGLGLMGATGGLEARSVQCRSWDSSTRRSRSWAKGRRRPWAADATSQAGGDRGRRSCLGQRSMWTGATRGWRQVGSSNPHEHGAMASKVVAHRSVRAEISPFAVGSARSRRRTAHAGVASVLNCR